jgi:hypothetical protein
MTRRFHLRTETAALPSEVQVRSKIIVLCCISLVIWVKPTSQSRCFFEEVASAAAVILHLHICSDDNPFPSSRDDNKSYGFGLMRCMTQLHGKGAGSEEKG